MLPTREGVLAELAAKRGVVRRLALVHTGSVDAAPLELALQQVGSS